jgi:hypothetical protein
MELNMKKIALLFLAIWVTGCSVVSANSTQDVQPEQEAIEAMILAFTAGRGTEGKWDKQKVTDFAVLQLSDADIANNIEQRVCITLSYIEKNDQGTWEDKSISFAMEKKEGEWQETDWLKNPPDVLDAIMKISSGNCDWAREFYGVSD